MSWQLWYKVAEDVEFGLTQDRRPVVFDKNGTVDLGVGKYLLKHEDVSFTIIAHANRNLTLELPYQRNPKVGLPVVSYAELSVDTDTLRRLGIRQVKLGPNRGQATNITLSYAKSYHYDCENTEYEIRIKR